MIQTQQQIEKLKTIQESLDFYADVAENQLPALAEKIDNIKLPEIDTSVLEGKIDAVGEKVDGIKIPDITGVIGDISIGKQKIVDAIKLAGGNATLDMDLSDLSEQVKTLAINGMPLIDEYNIVEFVDGFTPKSAGDIFINRDKVKKIESYYTIGSLQYAAFSEFTNLEEVILHNVNKVGNYSVANDGSLNSISIKNNAFRNCKKLKRLIMNSTQLFYLSFTNIGSTTPLYGCESLEELILPNVENCYYGTNSYETAFGQKLKKLDITNAKSIRGWAANGGLVFGGSLIDVITGKQINLNSDFLFWLPIEAALLTSNSLVEEGEPFSNNNEKLNYNLREHFAVNLADRTGKNALTLTFTQALRNAMTEETELAFTSKNWNIAPAKSV